jgi:putative OPT family oligopeptide transporter
MRQLTWRAILMGSVLGGVMSLTNLYIGLKVGWQFPVAITACILSYAIWKGLRTGLPGVVRSDFTILENNCMQSTATAAGYSVGNTMVSAIAAMLMLTGQHMGFWVLLGWNVLLGLLGVFMAVPLKRQMVNVEQLRFPSGTAAAETLKSLHATGEGAVEKSRALGIAGVLAAAFAWMRDATFRFMPWNIPASFSFGGLSVRGIPLERLTLTWDMQPLLMAAGAIMGLRVAWSMFLGAIACYGILAPWMIQTGDIVALNPARGIGFGDITRWGLWIGASMMVVSSLTAVAFSWRTVARALGGLARLFRRRTAASADPLAAIEVPPAWVIVGFAVTGAGAVWMLHATWGVAVWMGILAVLMTWVLAMVACRATGETDTTPTGAMGKVTQLTYGVLAPSNMTTNLMTASVTANAAGCAADLLTDLKSGFLLGANPRKQFIAQAAGILPGAIVVGLAWYVLVPSAQTLGTERFPAPPAQVWKSVAELLSNGLATLPASARWGAAIGALLGLLLPVAERVFPRARAFIPSATGLGLAFVVPGSNSISFLAGALVATAVEKWRSAAAEKYVLPVASGVIAGESLMAILVNALLAMGVWGG